MKILAGFLVFIAIVFCIVNFVTPRRIVEGVRIPFTKEKAEELYKKSESVTHQNYKVVRIDSLGKNILYLGILIEGPDHERYYVDTYKVVPRISRDSYKKLVVGDVFSFAQIDRARIQEVMDDQDIGNFLPESFLYVTKPNIQ